MDSTDDPYAPRSSQSYARAAEYLDSSVSSASNTPSDASSSTSYCEAGSSSSSFKPWQTDGMRSQDAQEEYDEPLFGGTPFRDSQRAGCPPFSDPSTAEGADSFSGTSASANKDEFYALLNVDKDASEERIREAYRNLAVVLHPDKHTDPVRKSAADSQFRRIQEAYEVLSDAEKRGVYDHFGEAGLSSSWALSARGKTPQEMRAEFEKELLERRTKEAENLIRSKGDFTAMIDATPLFAPAQRMRGPPPREGQAITLGDRWNGVGVTQLIGRHGFETQISNTSSVNFTGQMMTRGGLGGGNLIGTVKTQWSSRFGTETALALLRPRTLTSKGAFALDENTFFTYVGAMNSLAMPPTFTLTAGQRISKTSLMTGFTTFRTGSYQLGAWGNPESLSSMQLMRREPAGVSIGVTSQSGESRSWTVQSTLSTVDTSLSFDWGTKVLGGVKLRLGASLGTSSGLSLNVNCDRRVTETVRLGLGLTTGLPGGVTLRIKFNRLGQKVVVPIVLAPEFRSDLVLAFTAIPAATVTVLHYYYILPGKRRRIESKLQELRKDNEEMIRERRETALSARNLLREQARKRWMFESSKAGFVVLEAWYGKRSAFPPPRQGDPDQLEHDIWEAAGGPTIEADSVGANSIPTTASTGEANLEYWDVRIPLQAMVAKGQLIIAGGRPKSHIMGFHDPCMGDKKHLRVRYLFRNRIHEVIVDDVSPFAAPLRAHQLQ
ncbi:hypothetical protein K437DRAFT_259186 [Tilletiaria anomala UBC 951]|uniref:J domain-containing protein n=1 Tax=Tilletiaria anomala (strain ATCC 24038 / CBS 436.72 / UBC 951) TaxID=1037660 RepID=A0A066VJZ4_TILAU|nr:uncharacterized protein K437DRAFT_259186 [Tilletiaria anomala UBC 951]KDN39079.1 hypothetical protein K437DRAFT_259186 [Tilletiaria anomala UBC 951]